MWDFPQYTSKEQAFSGLFRSSLEAVGAGTRAKAWASKTALKICCKSFSKYLRTLVAVAGDFSPKGLLGYLKISDLEGGKKPERVTEGAIEGVTEGHSRQKQSRPRIEIILV